MLDKVRVLTYNKYELHSNMCIIGLQTDDTVLQQEQGRRCKPAEIVRKCRTVPYYLIRVMPA